MSGNSTNECSLSKINKEWKNKQGLERAAQLNKAKTHNLSFKTNNNNKMMPPRVKAFTTKSVYACVYVGGVVKLTHNLIIKKDKTPRLIDLSGF